MLTSLTKQDRVISYRCKSFFLEERNIYKILQNKIITGIFRTEKIIQSSIYILLLRGSHPIDPKPSMLPKFKNKKLKK